MSADAESAYGQPWFQRGATPYEPAAQLEPSSSQLKTHSTAYHHTDSLPRLADASGAVLAPGFGAVGVAAPAPSLAEATSQVAAGVTTEVPSFFRTLQVRVQQALNDQVMPVRLASHLSVLLVAGAVLLFSRLQIPAWDFQLTAMPTAQPAAAGLGSVTRTISSLLNNPVAAMASADELQPQIVPFTIIPERTRPVVQIYTVGSGDTVLGIAQRFGLQPETLQWSNPALENNPDLLQIGDQVKILPLDGVLHTVRAGDTLSALATRYKVGAEQIIAYSANNLADAASPLIIGSDLVIPGGAKLRAVETTAGYAMTTAAAPAGASTGSGSFAWPSSGQISQGFWGGHPAYDIASYTGAPVKATDAGYVTTSGGGWNGGYGNYVVIDHGNGFVTLYAHMNSIFVSAGESVTAGQQIGTVGNTGRSTGPHLHFEIRYQGYAKNPGSYLR